MSDAGFIKRKNKRFVKYLKKTFRPKSLGLHRLGGESKTDAQRSKQICLRARRQHINEEKGKCQECLFRERPL